MQVVSAGDSRIFAQTPTWSSGPDGLALLGGAPLRTTPLSPSTSTSMPCDRADMPAPLSALATTRDGADAAPRMEREEEELGLAIAESAWYAAMRVGECGHKCGIMQQVQVLYERWQRVPTARASNRRDAAAARLDTGHSLACIHLPFTPPPPHTLPPSPPAYKMGAAQSSQPAQDQLIHPQEPSTSVQVSPPSPSPSLTPRSSPPRSSPASPPPMNPPPPHPPPTTSSAAASPPSPHISGRRKRRSSTPSPPRSRRRTSTGKSQA